MHVQIKWFYFLSKYNFIFSVEVYFLLHLTFYFTRHFCLIKVLKRYKATLEFCINKRLMLHKQKEAI